MQIEQGPVVQSILSLTSSLRVRLIKLCEDNLHFRNNLSWDRWQGHNFHHCQVKCFRHLKYCFIKCLALKAVLLVV